MEPEEWPVFTSYLEDIKPLKGNFTLLELIHVPRTQNTRPDNLTSSAMNQQSFIVHIDAELPFWFTESQLSLCMLLTKKHII